MTPDEMLAFALSFKKNQKNFVEEDKKKGPVWKKFMHKN